MVCCRCFFGADKNDQKAVKIIHKTDELAYDMINPKTSDLMKHPAPTFCINHGILEGANVMTSPNFNERPPNAIISGIVIHNISLPPSNFGRTNADGVHFVKAFFQNKLNANDHAYFKTIANLQVSAHLFIERDGTVTQFVNFNDRAWHAGQSSYLGRANCNDFTIGIELEGDDFTPFTDEQYEVLASIIIAIYATYPVTQRQLMGHSDIAPKRKSDPGEHFEWHRLRQMVQNKLNKAQQPPLV